MVDSTKTVYYKNISNVLSASTEQAQQKLIFKISGSVFESNITSFRIAFPKEHKKVKELLKLLDVYHSKYKAVFMATQKRSVRKDDERYILCKKLLLFSHAGKVSYILDKNISINVVRESLSYYERYYKDIEGSKLIKAAYDEFKIISRTNGKEFREEKKVAINKILMVLQREKAELIIIDYLNEGLTVNGYCELRNISHHDFKYFKRIVKHYSLDLYNNYKLKIEKQQKLEAIKLNEACKIAIKRILDNIVYDRNRVVKSYSLIDYYLDGNPDFVVLNEQAFNICSKSDFGKIRKYIRGNNIPELSLDVILKETRIIKGHNFLDSEKINAYNFLTDNKIPVNNKTYVEKLRRDLDLLDTKQLLYIITKRR